MAELKVYSPFSGELVGTYPKVNFKDLDSDFDKLRSTQTKWAQMPLAQRIQGVSDCLNYFQDNSEQISKDISLQMGRPVRYCAGEVSGMLARAKYMLSVAEQALADDIIEDSDTFYRAIRHEAYGVVFVISPWNYPLLTAINSIVPALVSGNTILLKHSSLTPEMGDHFAKAFGAICGLSDLLIHKVMDHSTTGEVIESGFVDHVVFTGSVDGGAEILKHCAETFISPQLELGGKDAVYIEKSCDLNQAIDGVLDGAMFNSGQSCCGTERVYVDSEIYDQFIEKIKSKAEGFILGDPMDEKTTTGPLAKPKSVDLMKSQIASAKKNDANVLFGGQVENIGVGVFFQPTVIEVTDNLLPIMQEENFGPILPILKVTGPEEAADCVNQSQFGLTSAIYTSSVEIADEFSKKVKSGTVFMNRCDYLDPALPWTGYKKSGCGSGLSKYGYHGVTQKKSIHFKKKF